MRHSQFSKLQTFKKISKHEKKPSMIAAPGGGIITWAIRRAFLPMTNVWLDVWFHERSRREAQNHETGAHNLNLDDVCGTIRSLEIDIKIISISPSQSQLYRYLHLPSEWPFHVDGHSISWLQFLVPNETSSSWFGTHPFSASWWLMMGGRDIGRVHFAVICLDRFIFGNNIS